MSLDSRVGKDQDTQLGDLIEDGKATPEETLTHDELHNDLEGLLDELTSREAAVLRRRFGLEDDTPQTLAQIGEDLQLSRERVRQIETRALLKLRQPQKRSKIWDYIHPEAGPVSERGSRDDEPLPAWRGVCHGRRRRNRP